MSATMTAVVQRSYGGPATLEVVELPVPVAAKGEVLVRVAAASLNKADLFIMTGEPFIVRTAFGFSKPRVEIQGRDVAGTVVATGPDVTLFSVGDEVFAESTTGSLAEFIVVDEKFLALKPSTATFEQAATIPLAGVTALQGVRDLRGRVLITGASGGVGAFAVQLARHFGAEVTAESSARNVDFVRSLGAVEVIDYASDSLDSVAPFDAIFDLAGQRSLGELARALTPRGQLSLSSGAGGRVLGPLPRMADGAVRSLFAKRSIRAFAAKRNAPDLVELARLVDAGALTPAIDSVFALKHVRDAADYLRDGHPRGKVVITVP